MSKFIGNIYLDSTIHSVDTKVRTHLKLDLQNDPFPIGISSDHFIKLSASKIPTILKHLRADLKNNTIRYSINAGVDYFTVTFPDQVVSPESIHQGLTAFFESKGHYEVDAVTSQHIYPFLILVNESAALGYTTTTSYADYKNVRADLTNSGTSTFYQFYGFTAIEAVMDFTASKTFASTDNVDFGSYQFYILLNGINLINYGEKFPNQFSGSFTLGAGTNSTPNSYYFLPNSNFREIMCSMSPTKEIRYIDLKLVDNNGNLLIMNDTSEDSNIYFNFQIWRS